MFKNNQQPRLGTGIKTNHPLTRGLVARFLMNEGMGNKVYDSSYNRLTGTPTNFVMPTDNTSGWQPCRDGYGLKFNRAVETYISLGAANPLLTFPTGEYTFAFRFRANGDYTNLQAIIGNTVSAGNSGNFAVTFGWADNKLQVWNGVVTSSLTSNISIADDDWRRIVVTRSGKTGAWNHKIYIDGRLDSSVIGSVINPSGTSYPTAIGRFGDLDGHYLNGFLQDFCIWNRELTAQEVLDDATDEYGMFRTIEEPFWLPTAAPATGNIKSIDDVSILNVKFYDDISINNFKSLNGVAA